MERLSKFSNFARARNNAGYYLQPSFKNEYFKISTRKGKKYMVYNPATGLWSHFGQLGYEDFTKHLDLKRRENYLARSAGIHGDWSNDKYSPNALSRAILWN
jgi:hypothetical protein